MDNHTHHHHHLLPPPPLPLHPLRNRRFQKNRGRNQTQRPWPCQHPASRHARARTFLLHAGFSSLPHRQTCSTHEEAHALQAPCQKAGARI